MQVKSQNAALCPQCKQQRFRFVFTDAGSLCIDCHAAPEGIRPAHIAEASWRSISREVSSL